MSRHVYQYTDVLKKLSDGKRTHLLLGNGFSIGCDSCFSYPSLYEASKDNGLTERAQKIFDRYGTNNFEAVMRLLDDGHWLAEVYGLVGQESEMRADLVTLKNVLIEAIAHSHPDHTGKIQDEKKKKASEFLTSYYNVFSLNYDLLPYWINMSLSRPIYQDGFREDSDDPEAPSLVFSERLGDKQGLYFIHGALHLFMGSGGLRKHCWRRTDKPITTSIREGLEMSRYPLFVAEGSAHKKMEQIHSNGYLSYCYGKLGRIKNRLVTYGFSFGDSDQHICELIAENFDVTELCIGVYKHQDSYPEDVFRAVGKLVAYRKKLMKDKSPMFQENNQLSVMFFDSFSANVWG